MKALYPIVFRAAAGAAALAGFPLAAAPLPPTHFHTGTAEITGYADLNGNGRADPVIIDRATGTLRAGFQPVSGPPVWTEPYAVGLYHVTGATAGRFISADRDTVAVTATEANRLRFITYLGTPPKPAAFSRTPVILGPTTLAAGQISGTGAEEDLVLASSRNAGVNYRVDLFANDGGGGFNLAASAQTSNRPLEQAARVKLAQASADEIAYLDFPSVSGTLRVLHLNSPGFPERLTVPDIPLGSHYILHPFLGPLAELVTWTRESSEYTVRAVTLSGGVYATAAPQTRAAPFPLGQLAGIPAGNAAHLLLIAADGTQALIRAGPAGADVQTLHPPPGTVFTGALAQPGAAGGFQILHGPSAYGRSTGATAHVFDSQSGTHAEAGTSDLPPVTPVSGAGHIMVYAGEPFVAPDAAVLARLRAGDWSSQPVLGAQIQVTAETFGGFAAGLGDPSPADLGPAPVGSTHLLVSQFDPAVSVFSLSPAEGRAAGAVVPVPPPGTSSSAVQIELSGPPGWTILYRLSNNDPWTTYTAPFWLHKTTTVQAFAQNTPTQKTPILHAAYTFTAPPGQLDSLGDGVPDYVLIGLGHNPTQLPDRDSVNNPNETLNYLQIVLEGENVPLSHTSGTALTVHARPHSHNGADAATAPALVAGLPLSDGSPNPGAVVTLRDVNGEPVDSALANNWGYFGAGQTAARLTRVGRSGRASLLVADTNPHFALDFTPPYDAGSPFVGRQLVGLVSIPAAALPVYEHSYGGGPDAAEAVAWIAGAAAFYTNLPPPQTGATLDPLETALLLVFEHWTARRFVERGILPPAYLPAPGGTEPPTDFLTLTPARTGENAAPVPPGGTASGRVFASPEQLASLENYRDSADTGHSLVDVAEGLRSLLRDSPAPSIAALRDVTLDVYRIAARWGGVFPGSFPSPVDALREFFATGAMPRAYTNDWADGLPPAVGTALTALGPAHYAAAMDGLALLLGTPSVRPLETLHLRVTAGGVTYACTVLERLDNGAAVALVDRAGDPLRFPGSFIVVPGTTLLVTGYTDLPAGSCAPGTLEVISVDHALRAIVEGIPPPGDDDLLPADWSLHHFGTTGLDPFGEPFGDGYTYLQLLLDGSDPWLPLSYTAVEPAHLKLPVIHIQPANPGGNDVLMHWSFPVPYAGQIQFKLHQNTGLAGAWTEIPLSVLSDGMGNFEASASLTTEEPGTFWRVSLQPK